MSDKAREAFLDALKAQAEEAGYMLDWLNPERGMSGVRLDGTWDFNTAIDAYIAARREEGFVELGPTDRWIKIGEGGATFEWRAGSEFTAHNVSIGAYYETPGAEPVTVYRAMLNAAEQQR